MVTQNQKIAPITEPIIAPDRLIEEELGLSGLNEK
jgi:hypothetical protein